jgi:transposase
MIPGGVEIFLGLDPIDLRWSFDRLSGLVAERIGRQVRGGALFVFFGRRRDALKILYSDGTGLCLFYKRLDRGTFRMPDVHEPSVTAVELDERTLDALLDGIEIEGPSAKKARRVH